MLVKIFNRRYFEIVFRIFLRKQCMTFHTNKETTCMNCQSLFSVKKKNITNLSSTEFVLKVVKVKGLVGRLSLGVGRYHIDKNTNTF